MPVEEIAMDTRTSLRWHRAAAVLLWVLWLAGCNPVYTIHSIAGSSDEASLVPDLSGLWVESDATATSDVLHVEEVGDHAGQCRNANIRMIGMARFSVQEYADEICFVPVAGRLIAQVRTIGEVQLYQQFLFRFDEESVSFCGSIWSDLVTWSADHPEETAAHGLEFTRRRGGESGEVFVISPPSALLRYLEARLPEEVKACDKADDEGHTEWLTFVRLTPRRPSVGIAEDASPLPPD